MGVYVCVCDRLVVGFGYGVALQFRAVAVLWRGMSGNWAIAGGVSMAWLQLWPFGSSCGAYTTLSTCIRRYTTSHTQAQGDGTRRRAEDHGRYAATEDTLAASAVGVAGTTTGSLKLELQLIRCGYERNR